MIQLKLCTASSYIPESNWARASASRTLRDSGSELAAWVSRVTAAAGFPPSSRSRPRMYQSSTSPCGRTSGGGGGASANGGRGWASSSQSSSRWLRTYGLLLLWRAGGRARPARRDSYDADHDVVCVGASRLLSGARGPPVVTVPRAPLRPDGPVGAGSPALPAVRRHRRGRAAR